MHFDDIPPWLIAMVILIGVIILTVGILEAGIDLPDHGAGQRMIFN